MRLIRVSTGLLTGLMAATIAYGFAAGSFGDEGRTILDLAWGRVTLIDLYVGLVLFGGWILMRERSWRAAPWLIALVFLGNLATALYAFVAAIRADSPTEFLTGRAGSDGATSPRQSSQHLGGEEGVGQLPAPAGWHAPHHHSMRLAMSARITVVPHRRHGSP